VIPLAVIVETKQLLETVAYSLVAAIGVTTAFSVAIYGVTRSAEFRRDERTIASAAAGALAAFALAICVAAIVLAVIVMTTK
jgi:cytochrome c biogenesis protein CcdA